MAGKRKTLISTSDYQQSRQSYYTAIQESMQPHPNGVSCPMCGQELWDSTPNVVLTSMPPQKNVHCPDCNYRGYLLA